MDRAVQKTDDDATSSKYSAISKGYFEDKYLSLFCVRPPPPRLPLINIGTYCRVQGIESLVKQFLRDNERSQRRAIVSLGAGSDTRPFHLLPKQSTLEYHELDFTARTTLKARTIRSNPVLHEAIGPELNHQASQSEIHTQSYHLYGVDLRTLSKQETEIPDPLKNLFEQRIPTLLLSECCLCYMPPEASDGVLEFFARNISQPLLSLAMYEPVALNDEFGRVMAENLAMRGLSLPTFNLYNTPDSQRNRLVKIIGATETGAVDIETVYDTWLTGDDHNRVSRLEFLDEVEEMRLLMRHYCVAWAIGKPK